MAWRQHHSPQPSDGSVDTIVASPCASPGPITPGSSSSSSPEPAFHTVSIEDTDPPVPRRPGLPPRVPVPIRTSSDPTAAKWTKASTPPPSGDRIPSVHWSSLPQEESLKKQHQHPGGRNGRPRYRRGADQKNAKRRGCFSFGRGIEETWTFEVVSLLMAVAAVGAIVGVLARHDQQPLPSWPHTITLNALIALLATIAHASLALPLSSGLSQLKWIRFRTKRTPLADMELFDEASRGTLGAATLLVKLRGGFIASFGALIAILALGLNPFAQQIATYSPGMSINANALATNPRSIKYFPALPSRTAKEGFVPILPLKNAVYNGLFAENGKPWLNLPFSCPTGNCTWPAFETLALCSRCVDMTEYLSRFCEDGRSTATGNFTECGWQLPNGAVLPSSAHVFGMTPLFSPGLGGLPYSTIMKLVFMGTEAQGGVPGVPEPWARQCSLDVCVQTLESTVVNGELRERVIHTVVNNTVPKAPAVSDPETGELEPIFIRNAGAGSNDTFAFGTPVMMALRSWFADLFRTAVASRNDHFINNTVTTPDSIVVNLTVGISKGQTFFDTDIVQAFYWNYYEYPTGIDMLMGDLATSATVSLRSFFTDQNTTVNVQGDAFTVESFVHVRWGFVAVPVVAVILTALFLGLAVWRTWQTRTELWKSSVLATLLHGLDGETRERFDDNLEGNSLSAQRREARLVEVRLGEGEGCRLSMRD